MSDLIAMVDPYLKLMRLHKPIGAFLLFIPCLWGLALDQTNFTFLWVVLFALGALIMRGAGCIINDIIDRDYDRKVERTKIRPLASGRLTFKEAFLFLALLLFISFFILLQFPLQVIFWGAASLILVVLYPFMKRITYWPQLFLGFTFNWGVILGWLCLHEKITLAPFLLYVAGVFWTLSYDTIYAHQDKKDDILIGVKSTALLFGSKSFLIINIFYFIAWIFIFFSGILSGKASIFYILWLLGGFYLIWQMQTLNLNNPLNCQKKFESNLYFGLIIFFAFFLG